MRFVALAACALSLGCGSSRAGDVAARDADPPIDAAEGETTDARPDADFGTPSTTYPARMPSVPQIADSGGTVMRSVRVVPIFFPGDVHQSTFVDFVSKLSASPYWGAEVREYGVGALSTATPIVLAAAPPATLDDRDIASMIRTRVEDGSLGDNDLTTLQTTVFVLHVPSSTNVTEGTAGVSCSSFYGYHGQTASADGPVIYAVLAECEPEPEKSYTAVIAHELAEAATDPYPVSSPAYLHVDQTHIAWERALSGGEIADLCSPLTSSYFTPEDLGYRIQRTWSNAAMAAFHDPCVPAAATTPYFASVPRFDEDMPVELEGKHYTAKGLNLRVGETKTVDVELLSDGPTSGAWELSVRDWLPVVPSGASSVELSLDRTSGVNGEKVHLTITATRTNPSGGTVIAFRSVLGGVTRHWFGGVKIDP
jgi:hypothetical protein